VILLVIVVAGGVKMPYYRVFFRYVGRDGKIHKDHTRLDASSQADAKKRTIHGEKPKMIAVDRIVKL
jgi:hypothetical protein